jgi:uncharacterized repeat protein (TIGR02543 family)
VRADALGFIRTYAGYRHDPAHPQGMLSGVVKGDGSLTLRLYYTLKDYTVSYDLNGGNGNIAPRAVAWSDADLLPATVPARANHTFAGWESGAAAVTADTAFSALAPDDTVDGVTLTAQWTRNLRSVTYMAGGNGVTGLPDGSVVSAGDAYAIPSGTPARGGYTFGGWSASSGGVFAAGASFTMPDHDVAFAAVWDAAPGPGAASGNAASNISDNVNAAGNVSDNAEGNVSGANRRRAKSKKRGSGNNDNGKASAPVNGGNGGGTGNASVADAGTIVDAGAATDADSGVVADADVADSSPDIAPGGAENATTVTTNENDMSVIDIGGVEVPLLDSEDAASLGFVNIMCLIIMLAAVTRSLTRYATARRRDGRLREHDWESDSREGRIRSNWLAPEVVLAMVGALVFFLTENFSGRMSLLDAYTSLQTAIMAGVIVLHRLASRDLAKAEEDLSDAAV